MFSITAYVIPPVRQTGRHRKHEQHLELVRRMIDDHVDLRVGEATSLQALFEMLGGYPSFGRFLAFQLAIDLNYGPLVSFSEMDFVAAGPGAREGIRGCGLRRPSASSDLS